ncbi:MAG TPA: LamG domain-containing protein [Polyangia bacterium]|nr:LamG domain-containing protein [Polyangia bacterium]
MAPAIRPLQLTVAVAGLLATATPAGAATRTWIGTHSSNASDTQNWSGGVLPGAGDDVVLDGSTGNNPMVLDLNAITVNSITVQNGYTKAISPASSSITTVTIVTNLKLTPTTTGGSFQFPKGTTTIGGSFTNNGKMTVDPNAGIILFAAASGSATHTFGGATLNEVIFNDGLAGYWTFDDGSGATFADASGNGNTGTLNTASWTTTVPTAVDFTDTSAGAFTGTIHATIGTSNLPATTGAQTVSAWVKFGATTATADIVAVNDGANHGVKVGLVSSGVLAAWTYGGTTLTSTTAPSDGLWHHVAYTYDGTTNKLYLDGALKGSSTTAHQTVTGTSPQAFVGTSDGSHELLNASLDELRIYKRALGITEISGLALGGVPATASATHTLADALTTTVKTGDIVIASGLVTGAQAISVGGSWLNYGGRFTGTGTVALNSTQSSELLQTGGQPFSNLSCSATAGKYTMQDRLWVPNGTLSLASQTCINGGAPYVMHVGTISDATNGGLDTDSGYVVLDGTSSSTFATKKVNGLRIEDPSETGLVAYWKLDEGGGTTLRDWSTTGNTATLAGGSTWTAASTTIGFDNAAAVAFDGASGSAASVASVASLPKANAAQSISVWAKLSSTTGTQTMVAMTASGSAIKLGISGGAIAVSKSSATLIQAAAPSTGAWHNIVFTSDGTNDKLYIDGTVTTGSAVAHDTATPTAAFLGGASATTENFNGSLDDVRVYNVTLTAAQVGQLAKGRYAGTGGVATVTLTGTPLNILLGDYGLVLDSGNFYTNDQKVTVSVTTIPCIVNSGTLHLGSAVTNCDGGLTINPSGTLLMDTAGGQFQPGDNSVVAVDGTLIASNTGAIISRDNSNQTYTFQVGTFSGSTPTLNITGLQIKFIDANGMMINVDSSGTPTGAVTTFTHFDNVQFTKGTATGAQQFLNIYATSLFLSSSGCSFGDGENTVPSKAVKLTGNGTSDGETRAVFGGTACASAWYLSSGDHTCTASAKSDDDSSPVDGVGDNPSTNGAVVQFNRSVETDTAGSVIGFPTAAFDWNTFNYYSTYVAFHDASAGTNDTVYVRDETGAAQYSWTVPTAGETISGTPQWNSVTVGAVTTHYLYVSTNGASAGTGKIYRLVDDPTGKTLALDAAWTTNPVSCGCTITTPLAEDTTNLYWGSTTSGKNFFTMGQSTGSSSLSSIMISTATVTSAALSITTIGGTSYSFLGLVGDLLRINTFTQTTTASNSSLAGHSVTGRIVVGYNTTGLTRVYAGDDGGTMWAIDPTTNFATTGGLWSYVVKNGGSNDPIKSSPYYDHATDTIQFGTQAGQIVVLDGTGAAPAGYPFTPTGGSGDAITAAPLYNAGVIVIGSTGGKLYFIDRKTVSTGTPKLISEYYFGPGEAVSGVAFDPTVNRYMVTTANAATNDGRLYYFDLVADPTSGSS